MLWILLRQERTAFVSWGVGLFLYLLLIGSSYATVKGQSAFDELWDQYPEGLRQAFGDVGSITTVEGYFVTQAGSYLPLLFGIYLVLAGTKRLAGAEEAGLLDHLLARPVTRRAYVMALGAATGGVAVGILLVAALGALLGFVASGVLDFRLVRIVAAMVDMLPAVVFWWGLGLLLGASFHQRSTAAGIGIAAALGSYALQILGGLVDALSWVEFLTPFAYYARSDLYNGSPDALYWILMPLVGLVLAVLGRRRFERKDLFA